MVYRLGFANLVLFLECNENAMSLSSEGLSLLGRLNILFAVFTLLNNPNATTDDECLPCFWVPI